MLRLIQAGLIAGCLQAIVVAVVTVTFVLYFGSGFLRPLPMSDVIQTDQKLTSIAPLLTWIYLLTALGVALTGNRFVEATAFYLRLASRRTFSTDPGRASMTILVQLWIAAVGFAVLALRPPPAALVEVVSALGCTAAASIAWPGLLSIGSAAFGANAYAAAKAI